MGPAGRRCRVVAAEPRDAFLRHAPLHLGAREVLVAVVHGLELAAVNRHAGLREQLIVRESATNRAQTCRIARPLSLRTNAIVLVIGSEPATSHITSTLRPASAQADGSYCTRLR